MHHCSQGNRLEAEPRGLPLDPFYTRDLTSYSLKVEPPTARATETHRILYVSGSVHMEQERPRTSTRSSNYDRYEPRPRSKKGTDTK